MSLSQSCPAWRAHRAFSNMTYSADPAAGRGLTGCQDYLLSIVPMSCRSVVAIFPSVAEVQFSMHCRQASPYRLQALQPTADLLPMCTRTSNRPSESSAFQSSHSTLYSGYVEPTSAVASPPAASSVDGNCDVPTHLPIGFPRNGNADQKMFRPIRNVNTQNRSLTGSKQTIQRSAHRADGVPMDPAALLDIALPPLSWISQDRYAARFPLSGRGGQQRDIPPNPNRDT